MQHLYLEFYQSTPQIQSLIDQYEIKENDYAVHPNKTLAERRSLPNNHLIMIKEEQRLIGFFCLDTTGAKIEYGGESHDLLFRSFSIDHRFRNRQYAENALYLLDPFVRHHFPDKKHLLLVVNHENIPAQKLYQKCGFHDTGRRAAGLYGEVFVYRKPLK